MKKITQNLIQSIWRSGLLAFVFLCSLSINSQDVGQEYLVNPGVNSATGEFSTTPGTGVNGSGNMPANLGGWTDGVGGAYAPTSAGNGDCHSEDRMFKFFKNGGAAGHYVSQDVVNLPAGNFNWSFHTKWGAVVDYDAGVAEKPTFTILTDDDADGTWEVVKTIITTEPTAIETWVQQNGVYNNQIARDVRIRFHKSGANLAQLMYVDDVSLTYASTFTFPVDDTSLSALTQDGSPIAGFTESGSAYDISLAQGTTVVPTIAATTNNPSANLVITAATGIPGTTRIVVTAEDGTTTNTVSINFSIPALGVVGQEYLVNPGVNSATGANSTTPDTGVDGSGGFAGGHLGGWNQGANGAFAPTSPTNGDCHSEDRLFRFYSTNIAYVNQIIELPPGIYSWSFWTRWKGLVTWDAAGDKTPKFVISTDDDADGTWTADQTNVTTQPTAVNSWVRQTGTYTNDIQRQVRIQFYKDGSSNLNQEMYIDDVSLKFVGSNAWTGTTDTDWDTATNWSNGVVPIASSEVFIPGGLSTYPTASSAVTVSSLTMGSGASLMANSDFTGAVTYNRTLGTNNWYLISSPVDGQDKDAFVTASGFATGSIGSNVGFADYNNTTEAWSYYQSGTPVSGVLDQGEGHSVKLAIAGDVVFTGTFNDADVVSIPVTNNTNGFNLIGNPYLASVSVSELLNNNFSLLSESTVWLWDQSSSSYVQKNLAADLEIAPGQAFFISANTSGSFGITESMQSHSADTFQRTVAKPEVELSLSNGKASRTASIYYIDGTTTGFDNGYDSSIFGGFDNDFSLYTHAVANGTGRNLGIQSLPKGEYQNMIIPVGVIAESGSSLEFSASSENLPEGIKIYLEDREENTFIRLDALNASYKLTTESAINGVGRFYLHTNQSVLNINDASLDNVSVFKVNNSLRIVGLQQGRASVKLFNVLGRQVLNTVFESNGTRDISLPRLAKGVYIVHLETVEGALNKKIILE